ncbi:hypothetical protein BV898_08028 [Hypsibius exemplaris]|uniref:G-protein coupled receptors family 1 profile domain-containing protein n=1 Tax=Hypsibius exemplaris TaxID=2072580 RepID=A0A1W0WRT4_HYPEX|nr:hypothetical protein BV898_08028 [Hypsibius exemplaris]
MDLQPPDSVAKLSLVCIEIAMVAANVIGNGLVVISFIKSPRLRKYLPYLWLLHLAFANFLLGTAFLYHVLMYFGCVESQRQSCVIRFAISITALLVSLSLLVCLATHVFVLSVKFSFSSKAWVSARNLHFVGLVGWVCASAFGVLPILGVGVRADNVSSSSTGTVLWNDSCDCKIANVLCPWYFYLLSVILISLATAICAVYYLIQRQLKLRRNSSASLSAIPQPTSQAIIAAVGSDKALKTFMLASVSSVLCVVAFVSLIVQYLQQSSGSAQDFCHRGLSWLGSIAVLALFLHSCLNPIVYSFRLGAFRKSFSAVSTGRFTGFGNAFETNLELSFLATVTLLVSLLMLVFMAFQVLLVAMNFKTIA